MLDITDRACDVTRHMNVRGEDHGDNIKTAVDVMLKNIALTPGETNELLRDPDAYERLFRQREENSELLEPVFKATRGMALNYKIDSARIEIDTGSGKPLLLPECSLGRLFLTWGDGGKVTLAAQVQCVPNIDSAGGRLLKLIGCNVQVSITAQNEQQDLLPDAQANGTGAVSAIGSGRKRKPRAEAQADPPAAA